MAYRTSFPDIPACRWPRRVSFTRVDWLLPISICRDETSLARARARLRVLAGFRKSASGLDAFSSWPRIDKPNRRLGAKLVADIELAGR